MVIYDVEWEIIRNYEQLDLSFSPFCAYLFMFMLCMCFPNLQNAYSRHSVYYHLYAFCKLGKDMQWHSCLTMHFVSFTVCHAPYDIYKFVHALYHLPCAMHPITFTSLSMPCTICPSPCTHALLATYTAPSMTKCL